MKFNNQELNVIKKALVNRVYYLDGMILTADDDSKKLLTKERQECLNLIKYIS